MAGTNFEASGEVTNLKYILTDDLGLLLLAACTGTPPTTANVFQHGCLIVQTNTGTGSGALFQNIGSSAVPSWSLLDTAASSLVLPSAATDSTTTTGSSLALTETTLTSGNGILVTGSGATMIAGASLFNATMGAAIAGNAFTASTTGVYAGTGLLTLTANSMTTGTLAALSGNGMTTGHGLTIASTGVITTTGDLLSVTGNSATTSTGLIRLSATGLTSGTGLLLTGGGANQTSAGVLASVTSGAATDGITLQALSSGTYTGTVGIAAVSGLGATSGNLLALKATEATLTTGRYLSANDAATEVFGIGANGHIHSTVSAAVPTIAVSQQNGITAAAITAGGSDTCGTITTTGTNNNGGTSILQVTFGKTYTVAPKAVILQPLNASGALSVAANGNGVYISAKTATTFDITIPADAAAGATPSFSYLVIA